MPKKTVNFHIESIVIAKAFRDQFAPKLIEKNPKLV